MSLAQLSIEKLPFHEIIEYYEENEPNVPKVVSKAVSLDYIFRKDILPLVDLNDLLYVLQEKDLTSLLSPYIFPGGEYVENPLEVYREPGHYPLLQDVMEEFKTDLINFLNNPGILHAIPYKEGSSLLYTWDQNEEFRLFKYDTGIEAEQYEASINFIDPADVTAYDIFPTLDTLLRDIEIRFRKANLPVLRYEIPLPVEEIPEEYPYNTIVNLEKDYYFEFGHQLNTVPGFLTGNRIVFVGKYAYISDGKELRYGPQTSVMDFINEQMESYYIYVIRYYGEPEAYFGPDGLIKISPLHQQYII